MVGQPHRQARYLATPGGSLTRKRRAPGPFGAGPGVSLFTATWADLAVSRVARIPGNRKCGFLEKGYIVRDTSAIEALNAPPTAIELRAELAHLRSGYDCGAVSDGVYAIIKAIEVELSWAQHEARR